MHNKIFVHQTAFVNLDAPTSAFSVSQEMGAFS